MSEPRIEVRQDEGLIAVTARLDPEFVRSMTAVDQLNLGSLLHDAALRLVLETGAADD